MRPTLVMSGGLFGLVAGAALAAAPSPPTQVQLVSRTATSALIRWTPGVGPTRAFKIKKSSTSGVYASPSTFPGGRLAAFTWCTDDGWDANLAYAPIFESRGLRFTAFVIPAVIASNSSSPRLTWAEVEALHAGGHEIASHTLTHSSLIDDRAFSLRFAGTAACSLQIGGGHLRTWLDGSPDLDLVLTDPTVDFLVELVAVLDGEANYESNLLYAADTIPAARSTFLDPVAETLPGSGAPAETLTTQRGVHDDAELIAQILGAEEMLEGHLQPIDHLYACRTLAYPNHAHTQWAMSWLNEFGYLGARSGGLGPQPFFSTGAFSIGFNTNYEVPLSYPALDNAWGEATTRATVLARMEEWKDQHEWAVLMAHDFSETDSLHLEWAIDTISQDPEIWVARFDEVMNFLTKPAVDVGNPVNAAGNEGTAWIHDLAEEDTTFVVMTAYNADLEESIGSAEIAILPLSEIPPTSVPPASEPTEASPRAIPNPFSARTTIRFETGRAGNAHLEIWDLAGRRVRAVELGPVERGRVEWVWDGATDAGASAAAGIYWVRVEVEGGIREVGKVALLR